MKLLFEANHCGIELRFYDNRSCVTAYTHVEWRVGDGAVEIFNENSNEWQRDWPEVQEAYQGYVAKMVLETVVE